MRAAALSLLVPALAIAGVLSGALSGCATTRAAPAGSSPLAWARLGETVYVDGPRVTPREVLEDSRCPADVRCVWAGQVRLRADVTLGSGTQAHELTLGKPVQVADGSLELVEVRPVKPARGQAIAPESYRFGLRFMGGL